MNKKLSDRQRRMLVFIEEFVDDQGYPPTYEEIRAALGISTKSLVYHHLDALEEAGYLARIRNFNVELEPADRKHDEHHG